MTRAEYDALVEAMVGAAKQRSVRNWLSHRNDWDLKGLTVSRADVTSSLEHKTGGAGGVMTVRVLTTLHHPKTGETMYIRNKYEVRGEAKTGLVDGEPRVLTTASCRCLDYRTTTDPKAVIYDGDKPVWVEV